MQTSYKQANAVSLTPQRERESTHADAAPKIAFAQIEPVGQCNLRCRMCPIQFRQDGPPHGPLAFMEFETYRRLIDQLPGLKSLHLQGMGEPLMHPRFFDMVRYAVDRGIRVTTNTNMTLLSERRARLCVESGLAELHASFDGASAETYERIRVRARFKRTKRQLQTLMRVRAELGASTPKVHLIAVVMRDNLHELPALVEMAHAMRLDAVFVQHLCHDYGEEALPEQYRPMREFVDQQTLLNEKSERVQHYFGAARARAALLRMPLRLPRTDAHSGVRVDTAHRCEWPWRGPYISYQGEAMPCCMVGTPDRISLGNMAQHGVDAVWNDKRYADFRAALDSNVPPDICRSCAVYQGVF